MSDDATVSGAEAFLGEPILVSPGQPLRVAVYSRLSQGIRDGVLAAGTILPRETELAELIKVSRTVVREALMLLEEDGHIVTRRGVGRFVADALPHGGLERFQSIESLVGAGARSLSTTVLIHNRQEPTDFVLDHLPDTTSLWFRESVIEVDGRGAALVQEYLVDEQQLALAGRALADAAESVDREGTTMLASLLERLPGSLLSPGACIVAASIAGPTRAAHLSIKANDPVLVMTQVVRARSTPILVVKSAFAPEASHLSITQSSSTR
ncbi:MAG: GntR family transcriptional regulator [Microcella sp.]|uniref:GntR family transcriptional regulator n=1 Tax=Microcella sp. TaxID=1913979 RepID=UPI0024C89BD6|nr:GntR family transcriptional regulator [Microcella sp.]UYN83208.1 MAG: GntR family transcriptional regulator [Microcella sp.]